MFGLYQWRWGQCCSVTKSDFATPWTVACQGSLSFAISWSLLKLMSIELMMPSNHLISPSSSSPPAINLSQYQGVFQWVGSLHHVPQCCSFSFSISSSNEYSGLISFRIDCLLALLAVQGTLKSLQLHHSLKAPILWLSDFFMAQLWQLYMTTGKTTALMRQTFVGKVVSLLFNTCLGLS